MTKHAFIPHVSKRYPDACVRCGRTKSAAVHQLQVQLELWPTG